MDIDVTKFTIVQATSKSGKPLGNRRRVNYDGKPLTTEYANDFAASRALSRLVKEIGKRAKVLKHIADEDGEIIGYEAVRVAPGLTH